MPYFVLKHRLGLLHPVLIPASCAQLSQKQSQAHVAKWGSRSWVGNWGSREMGRGVLFHSKRHFQRPKEQCVGEVLSCSSFQQESSLLSAFVTFSLFPSFGQFATVTYTDDIRIFRLPFLKALLSTLYSNVFPGHGGGSSPLLINFFSPCLPAL